MIFDVIFREPKTQRVLTYTYDNITQEIRDERGEVIDFSTNPRFSGFFGKERNEHFFTPHKHHLTDLRIQLGLACNYHCSYCNQEKSRRKTESKVKLPDSVRLRNFVKILKEKRIEPAHVTLWGGEPLVYWKLILQLVPALEEALGKDVTFSFLTNGSLLTRDKARFCIDHRISIVLSHDGQSFSHYRSDSDPLDNPTVLDAIDFYRQSISNNPDIHFSINSVVCPENSDLFELERFFVSRLGEDVDYHFEGIVRLDYTNKDAVTRFDEKTAKQLFESIKHFGTHHSRGHLDELVWTYMKPIVNRKSALDIPIRCEVATDRIISTTFDGELLACHGSNPESYCYGRLENAHELYNDRVIPWWERERCGECPILINCLGGCAVLRDDEQPDICENEQLWNGALFWCVWFRLFDGAEILRITPHNP